MARSRLWLAEARVEHWPIALQIMETDYYLESTLGPDRRAFLMLNGGPVTEEEMYALDPDCVHVNFNITNADQGTAYVMEWDVTREYGENPRERWERELAAVDEAALLAVDQLAEEGPPGGPADENKFQREAYQEEEHNGIIHLMPTRPITIEGQVFTPLYMIEECSPNLQDQINREEEHERLYNETPSYQYYSRTY